jgi:type II secretory pathway component PulC
MKLFFILFLFLAACGGGSPTTETAEDQADEQNGTIVEAGKTEAANETSTSAKPEPQPIKEVTRAELDAVLNKKPAYILAMVQVDAVRKNGKFIGHKIIAFRTEAPSILGVQPEDVLQKINDIPLDYPGQYLEVLEALKSASEIRFSILRDGEAITLTTPIQ